MIRCHFNFANEVLFSTQVLLCQYYGPLSFIANKFCFPNKQQQTLIYKLEFVAAEVSGCLNDCSDFGSNLAYANYFFFFFNWVGRQVYIVSKCFSCLKNRKKRWGLAAHIAQAMTEVKAVMLTTWIKIAVYHSGGANGRKTMDFRGSKRAAVCYSMFRLA